MSVLLALLAVVAFHLGFLYAPLWWLVLVWLGCLFALRRAPSGRWAFYSGLAIGLGIYGPQLYFFWAIFGPAALALWLVLAFWLALFLLLLHGVDRTWGTGWAVALAPVLWLGIEFFRSELYYLRFSWLTAGSFLTPAWWPWGFSRLGVYGIGAVLMLGSALVTTAVEGCVSRDWRRVRPLVCAVGMVILGWLVAPFFQRSIAYSGPTFRVNLAGVQLEMPKVSEVLAHLDRLVEAHPETQWIVLGEYTFDGPIPPEVLDWCRRHRRHLIAGGKEPLPDGTFYNTAFVVSHEGEVVFRKAKAVPIQFFNDGRPAPAQHVWRPGMRTVFNPQQPRAPQYEWLTNWDEEDKSLQRLPVRVGLAVCYDLSFALVIDRLVEAGEHDLRLLLVPAMDAVEWGAHQHRLNARMTAIRAVENRLWIFRVATSGISQLVTPGGRVIAETSFPGQGEFIVGEAQGKCLRNRIPLDRVFGLLAVVVTTATLLALFRAWWLDRTRSQSTSNP